MNAVVDDHVISSFDILVDSGNETLRHHRTYEASGFPSFVVLNDFSNDCNIDICRSYSKNFSSVLHGEHRSLFS